MWVWVWVRVRESMMTVIMTMMMMMMMMMMNSIVRRPITVDVMMRRSIHFVEMVVVVVGVSVFVFVVKKNRKYILPQRSRDAHA